MPHSMSIMFLINEVVSLKLPLLHLLLVVLTHELCQSAIEFTDIIRKQLTVPKYLKQQLFLILFADEPTLYSNSLICNLLSTIIEDLLGPDASLLLFLESLDFQIALIEI